MTRPDPTGGIAPALLGAVTGETWRAVERCPRCDRPLPTDEQWDDAKHPDGCACPECCAACWSTDGSSCVRPAVDWRARALAAEKRCEELQRQNDAMCPECGADSAWVPLACDTCVSHYGDAFRYAARWKACAKRLRGAWLDMRAYLQMANNTSRRRGAQRDTALATLARMRAVVEAAEALDAALAPDELPRSAEAAARRMRAELVALSRLDTDTTKETGS